ncbi:5-oxoprolinase/urea amidolyase family protein [Pseudomonas fragariae (ex Marin et al. 2024)]|uniref:5-oxoprolinase/urea amidolyase family protein n=1 Tax=Pseudomonas fragariae (ex Marin et al. 2024) TaxID=3080056 RepID=A0ABT3LKD1_9PSED|nr:MULTISPECIES: 5-oxoprolinase/urea amidolyase family protein [unclassified Pseudomonas]MCW6056897.1 5-oxoprolinase/urea amidolyase family protein [Pseudomonas fragi]MDV0426978.1 5-oxoprolinase/urea amidolyase family protein [Pseudomonas sp. 17]MDX9572951.1 5-oxoprolinase/urea amidolyase family protein [Pseudomonas sp. 21(2023)]MDX9624713.1 5-oxoprolinase/urea amidolyase family protein [Pseudomonas sp. 20]MDY6478536.1 5-oxoprolinase/urea amidolyase family protein [Pseudomonas sp. 18]
MFDKLLIANRGAIACRILRTLRTLQVKGVAVYSEADAASLHLMQADEAHSLGEGGAAGTYLAVDKILAIANASGAKAIHPGYGFLSENAAFAQACEDAGIAFVGPTPEQLRVFGLKHTARALAKQHGVPMLEGTELLDSLESAIAAARTIGYPVMLKSTAGGGGIGMRVCRSAEELADSFEAVKRLGQNNFSDAGVFIEKYIQRARHLEVQVFGDGQGEVLALGVRDCSVQRRNQKVLEETPAPNLPHGMAEELCAAAVKLARAVNYRSAGTVEFVFDSEDQRFYFLEVNTRLQVEHGVTEQVWGVDLVSWMVQLAAGDLPPLDQLQAGLKPLGHAIQARLYAEDPGRDFQPCPGLLTAADFPPADGRTLRIDSWVEAGCEIPPYFDPMIAKLISWAPTREDASAGLIDALNETRLYGVETNRDYLRQIIADAPFASGQPWTRCLEDLVYRADTFEVLSGGTQTSVQDYPGRLGYWAVGVPPSGPMDSRALRQGNELLGNPEGCAALEITMSGPLLRFNTDAVVAVTGAHIPITLDGQSCAMNTALLVSAGSTLSLGTIAGAGVRSYLCVRGGLDVPDYLGSKSTFTLGQFGGHGGRALRAGDVLHIAPLVDRRAGQRIADEALEALTDVRRIRVIYGPHAAPEYFTEAYIERFFATDWEVHFNSSRTGVRLIGPKPEWVRADGGEAGLHPSNIHDNPYAIGAVDFTGDMPVILGPDGPSLGGFVCPVTIIEADLWQLGQLKAGDRVRFTPVSVEACHAERCGSELAREDSIPDAENPSTVPPSSRASSLPQGTANSSRNELVRENSIPDAETPSTAPPSSRASSLPQGPANSSRSEVVRESYMPDAENPSTATPSSRASSLPQGPANSSRSEVVREGSIPDAETPSTATPSSRASSLPQGPANARRSELVRENSMPDAENPLTAPPSSRASSLPQDSANSRRSELAREGYMPDAENPLTTPPSSRASQLPQGPANSRGSELAREGYIPDAENPLTAPPSSRASSLPQGTARLQGIANSRRSELVREGSIPDAENPSTATPSSRASSLPQGPANSSRSEVVRVEDLRTPVILDIGQDDKRLVARLSGDTHLLLEIGAPELDLVLRLRGHALMLALEAKALAGVIDLTPGIRSLQVHYRPEQLPLRQLLDIVAGEWDAVCAAKDLQVASRIVHLPLSWDDPACQLAIEKYMTTVRKDAPWCPSNLEFIRRINDLPNLDEVQRTVFDASYLVMGLGDVYLGAPVATPLDPRHRLVTTKYNPARTWTAENSVGIGGAYMCVYGMEGPGGYQFVGRTLQMWNRYRDVAAFQGKPWLLRFFDQIRFYPVSADELVRIRRDFPLGRFALNIEHSTLNLADYQAFLSREAEGITAFRAQQNAAFNAERERWIANGQADFQSDEGVAPNTEEQPLQPGQQGVDSHIAGNLWQVQVQPGARVEAGDVLVILESMKMEIPLLAPVAGVVQDVRVQPGSAVRAGQRVVVLSAD